MAKEKKTYIVLKKIKIVRQANATAKDMGWKNNEDFYDDTGSSLIGFYVDTNKTVTKKRGTKTLIKPIVIIVHNRVYSEKAEGYKYKNIAYVDEDKYQGVF